MSSNAPRVHDALNALLADSFALYLKTKNFHWHVSGPHFRDYHLMFDDHASQILATTDRIAERVRKTGGTTLRSIGDVARLQRIRDDNSVDLDARTMLIALRDDNEALLGAMREVGGQAQEAGDNATGGLIDELVDGVEERIWFLAQCAGR
jgi:starvation-inducible DNA-binding protein